MRLAIIMITVAYAYLALRVVHGLPAHSCVIFGIIMGTLTTANLIREWREH